MAFSSIAVVLSSLALNLYTPPPPRGARVTVAATGGSMGSKALRSGAAATGWVGAALERLTSPKGGAYKRVGTSE